MTIQRSLLLLACAAWCLPAGKAHATDVIFVDGTRFTTPEGWGLYEQGDVTVLFREQGKARVEVAHLPRVPAAENKVIADFLKGRNGTADVQVTKAAAWEHNGLKGTFAEGTAKDGDAAVRIRLVALPAGSGAVVATAILGKNEGSDLDKEIAGILTSIQPPPASSAADGPTDNEFVLKIENLVDNVADLDVRRITVLAATGKPMQLKIGEQGIRSYGHRTEEDAANVRRLEAIVVLRLAGEPASAKIRRLMKFHRTVGTAVEMESNSPGRESLAGVVDIKVKSGRYPVGKELVVGTVNGANIVVTAE